MNAAVINNKTIIIWNKLQKEEADRLLNVLKNIINDYSKILETIPRTDTGSLPLPIALEKRGDYLSVVKKGDYILLSTTNTKTEGFISFPILYGDELYNSIKLLENYKNDFKRRLLIYKNMQNLEWMELGYNKSVETFLLSPRPNPEDFIQHLQNNNLPDAYKQLLTDIGITLQTPETQWLTLPDLNKEDI